MSAPCFLRLLPRCIPPPCRRRSRAPLLPPPSAPGAAAIARACSSSSSGVEREMTARDRRQLRQERRDSRAASGEADWRETVEELVLVRKKKPSAKSRMDIRGPDFLAGLGPRWWMIRVGRGFRPGAEAADRINRSLSKSFPDLEFKVYYPAVHEKKRLKNNTLRTKSKPLVPGCVYLYCVLNKEVYDLVRECEGTGGFVGFKVGSDPRQQIHKPKLVLPEEIESILRQEKEEQKLLDRLFEENDQSNLPSPDSRPEEPDDNSVTMVENSVVKNQLKRRSRTPRNKHLAPGVTVRVTSGPFATFTGVVKELDLDKGKVTVRLVLFGKESMIEIEVGQIKIVNDGA